MDDLKTFKDTVKEHINNVRIYEFIIVGVIIEFAVLSVLQKDFWYIRLVGCPEEWEIMATIIPLIPLIAFAFLKNYIYIIPVATATFDSYYVFKYKDVVESYYVNLFILFFIILTTILITRLIIKSCSKDDCQKPVLKEIIKTAVLILLSLIIAFSTSIIPVKIYKSTCVCDYMIDDVVIIGMCENISNYDELSADNKEDTIRSIAEYTRCDLGIKPFDIYIVGDEIKGDRYILVDKNESVDKVIVSIAKQAKEFFDEDYQKMCIETLDDFEYTMVKRKEINWYEKTILKYLSENDDENDTSALDNTEDETEKAKNEYAQSICDELINYSKLVSEKKAAEEKTEIIDK